MRNLGVVGFRGLELQVVVWAGSRVTVHQNMDDGYKNCPVRAYKKRKQVEDRALKNEEGHTKRPEKYWPERWEDKVGGDQVTEVWVAGSTAGSGQPCRQVREGEHRQRPVGFGNTEVTGDLGKGSFSE